jgi:predicted AlkP superfamily phosphohydrolase/phosphomutase
MLIGLDGATFDHLGPLMEQGHLPHLKRITEEGAWGELESTRPPTTAPAWVACVTGTNPGKHGVFDFRESPFLDPRRPLISGRSVQAPKLWQILNHHGRRAGLLNVPVTYPPEEVDGYIISGMMTPSQDSDYTYPKALKEELVSALGDYVVNVDIPRYDVEDERDAHAFLDDIRYSFEKRAEALFYLMDAHPTDFLMAVFIITDRIQHLFWKYMMDTESDFYHMAHAERLRKGILSCYQAVDAMLGKVLERLDDDTDLFIVSDHGFGSTKSWINVNRWLERQGLLHMVGSIKLRKRIFYEAMVLNDSKLVHALIPAEIRRTIRQRVRGTRSTFKSDLVQSIDWDRTKAFFASIPAQGIYVNVKRNGIGTVEPGAEYEAIREQIRDSLYALTDPRTGEKIVDQVWFREEVYTGDQTEMAPDVLFVARDYSYLGRELLATRLEIESSMNLANGFHRMNGVFLAYGNNIRPGRVNGARILDITPTLLYNVGLPISENMDGRVLEQVLSPDYVASQPVRREAALEMAPPGATGEFSEEETEEIEARLRALGYIE